MRSFLAALLAVSLGWANTASAQPAYGDDDPDETDGYGAPAPVPTPPPPAAQLPAPPDDQQSWRYNGPHAVNAQYGTGFCNVPGVHEHPYPPFDDHLFQEQDGGYNFLGDPTDFGYSGSDLYWYSAAHPIAIGWGIGWCFMGFAHRHLYRPWGPYFSACGPYFCYTGPFDAYYWRWRGYWTPYWASYYPRYYRGGLYFRSRVAASPGRWAHAGVRRPGGYAHPTTGHRPGLAPARTSPYTRLPHAAPARPGGAPRLAPPRTAPPTRTAPPPRTYTPPRAHGAPHLSAPKSFSPSRSSSPSRPSSSSSSSSRSSGGGKRR